MIMMMSSIPRLLSVVLAAGLYTSALAVEGDWSQVAHALGKSGSEIAGGVYRVGLPRGDLKVTLDGVEVKPALALGSWLAFQKIGDQAMVMGDLVLTAEEVNPVMNKLMEGGIDITALHNHLLRSSPATLYMHVRGHGDPVKLATTLHTALAESKTPFQSTAYASAQPAAAQIDLDTSAIDQALGDKTVDLARRTLARSYKYEDWPRGRIVFDGARDLFVLYTDRKLLTPEMIARIQAQFHLLEIQ